MKIPPTTPADFATCPICFGHIQRVCTLARNEPDPFSQVVCGACYALVEKLKRLQLFGWVV